MDRSIDEGGGERGVMVDRRGIVGEAMKGHNSSDCCPFTQVVDFKGVERGMVWCES